MADNPPKAKSDFKSGLTNKEYLSGPLGGLPEKKNQEQIEKVNTPKNAPGSVRA